MKFFRQSLIVLSSILASLLSFVGSANSDGHGEFKLGVVTFLSGPAAEPFGVPAWNGGKLFIKLLNDNHYHHYNQYSLCYYHYYSLCHYHNHYSMY